MTIEQIKKALAELNEELKSLNVKGEVCLMGGAVMCLAFKTRESTQDIDALMTPSDVIQKAAFNVSQTLGLENNFWINDAVKVFNSEKPEFISTDFQFSNLNILIASAKYMFAMKALAARSGTNDEDDILYLKKHLQLNKIEEAMQIINQFYPSEKLSLESKALLKDLFG